MQVVLRSNALANDNAYARKEPTRMLAKQETQNMQNQRKVQIQKIICEAPLTREKSSTDHKSKTNSPQDLFSEITLPLLQPPSDVLQPLGNCHANNDENDNGTQNAKEPPQVSRILPWYSDVHAKKPSYYECSEAYWSSSGLHQFEQRLGVLCVD